MQAYVATFFGHYYQGSAVVVEASRLKAYLKLKNELAGRGIGDKLKEEDLVQLNLECESLSVLSDGNL